MDNLKIAVLCYCPKPACCDVALANFFALARVDTGGSPVELTSCNQPSGSSTSPINGGLNVNVKIVEKKFGTISELWKLVNATREQTTSPQHQTPGCCKIARTERGRFRFSMWACAVLPQLSTFFQCVSLITKTSSLVLLITSLHYPNI